MRRQWLRFSALIVLSIPIFAGYMNCAEPIKPATKGTSTSPSTSGSAPISITPATARVVQGSTLLFRATGGVPPYDYGIVSGSGSIDRTTGYYQTVSNAQIGETVVVGVRDRNNSASFASLTIDAGMSAITATFSPNPVYTSNQVTLTPSGGTAPYTYAMVSGGGTLTGNIYSAPTYADNAVIRITDSTQSSGTITIPVILATGPTPPPGPTPTPTPAGCSMGGVSVAGSCWYLGSFGQSCASVCESRGGYSDATRTYAGSSGSLAQCVAVMSSLGVSGSSQNTNCSVQPASGCLQHSNGVIVRCLSTTSSSAADSRYRRACACNN